MDQRKVKIVVAAACFVAAGLVAAWSTGIFSATPGAATAAHIKCPKCGHQEQMDLAKAQSLGAYLSTANGWMIRCPKCKEPVSLVQPGGTAATRQQ